jgi:hypothetical protein
VWFHVVPYAGHEQKQWFRFNKALRLAWFLRGSMWFLQGRLPEKLWFAEARPPKLA